MINLKRFSYLFIFPLVIIWGISNFSEQFTPSENFTYDWDRSVGQQTDTIADRHRIDGKQRGMHLFGRRELTDDHLKELSQNNIEWITVVPFVHQQTYDSERVDRREGKYGSWTRRDSFLMRRIEAIKSQGFYLMMKPHIWIRNSHSGKWRADILPKDKAGWESWSDSYKEMLLHYARMSELLGMQMLCIGTELHSVIKKHPGFWVELIREVRQVYSGQLTYAANWRGEVDDVRFWQELDYIGIQAYYPLTSQQEPTVNELLKGWRSHVRHIEALHRKYQKQVLFTEIGYKSTADAAIEPWQWANTQSNDYTKISFRTQANCYEAFFRTFWHRSWFAGAHIWEWQAGREGQGRRGITNFTPQHKPAQDVMAKWYGNAVD